MNTLAMTEGVWDELRAACGDRRESAGILAARLIDSDSDTTLLARTFAWTDDEHYLERDHDGLLLSSRGWVPAARAAIQDDSVVVFVHTHPRGVPMFSRRDDQVDESLRTALAGMSPGARYASLVVAGTPDQPTFTARIYTPDGERHPIDKFRIVGDRIRIQPAPTSDTTTGYDTDVFDRQVRAFGTDGQTTLRTLHVAVIGAGGTGSAVAEQLTRLGVGTLTIVDDDIVTAATPTRGYGTTAADLRQPKADVVARHLTNIGFGTTIHPVVAGVQQPQARAAFDHADIVFSCVDGHGARLVLNRWAYAHLAPVIDTAVLLSSDGGNITGIDARVTWLAPGAACLLCRGRLDPALAYAEMLDPDERRRLAGEGYAAEAETPQPAVVTLTSLVASLATTEMLNRLFGFGDAEPTELLVRVPDREIRKNRLPARETCFCTNPTFLGRGTRQPHLDLMWPT